MNLLLPTLLSALMTTSSAPIDRHALVTRHNIVLTKFNADRPMQVGNGNFAFGMDMTGLQTFSPFNTMSQWGWNSAPLPKGEKLENYHKQPMDTHGRTVYYPLPDPLHPELSDWLAGNPHRINLGRIGLILKKSDGTLAEVGDIKNAKQTLDLWSGIVTSYFELEGQPVTVTTACHPDVDSVAVKVDSPLVAARRLAAYVDCPDDDTRQFANFVGDWSHPGNPSLLIRAGKNRADFTKKLSDSTYHVSLSWKGQASLEKPTASAPPFQIVKAEYGAGERWADVTAIAQKAMVNGRLDLKASNDLAGDPALKSPKTLHVVYQVGGKTLTAVAPEGEDVVIDPSAALRHYTLQPSAGAGSLNFVCAFSSKPLPARMPDADATIAASQKHWAAYWRRGGAIDFSGSTDPRAFELERRVVLSQYQMAVNEAGAYPPQESGLVNNGWFGRWHMEMYWWHAAQWALWNKWPELDKSIDIYNKLLKGSTDLAKSEGYEGARWPKCIGPDLREWPFIIHSTLIWQQPHPIFFAELDYRAHPTKATLKKWLPVVDATADFMSSYAFWDVKTKRYVLGPPLYVASENTDPVVTQNPAYELGYWRFGLRTAQEWRKRLGLPAKPSWSEVLAGLSPLPQEDGKYVLYEGVKDMWTKMNFEHPTLSALYGLLPGDGVDKSTMQRTIDEISAKWNFERTWGWDYPMLAMCEARLGHPDKAVDYLMTGSGGFQFDKLGLATGGPFPYFPSNGALLYGVAMMAAGWDGSAKVNAPGFPQDGRWKIRAEGLGTAP